MIWTLRQSRPPWSLTIFCQTLYPCCAALPGSEKSPVSGSEAPMRIGLLDAWLVLPPPPPLLPPHAATTRDAVATSAGALHRSLLIALLLHPLQTFAAIDCDRSLRGAGLSSANASHRGAPVDPRGTNVGVRRTCGAVAPSPPRRSRRISAAAAPISRCGMRTVVSGGSKRSANGMSLKPTTETSSGQRRPRSASTS